MWGGRAENVRGACQHWNKTSCPSNRRPFSERPPRSWVGRSRGRSVGKSSWSGGLGSARFGSALPVGRSVGQSVGGGVGLCPTLGGPHAWARCCALARTLNPHNPKTAPTSLRITDPIVGRGAMGSHLRVVRPGGLSRLGGGLAAPEVARARKELPARRLADTQSPRALCVSQGAWHPATATQRWLARRLLERPPFISS